MTTPGTGTQPGTTSAAGAQGQPQQGTNVLVYAPDVNAYIATKTGVIDVSGDIVKGQLKRVENGVSQCTLILNNIKKQYTGMVGPMDRIIVYMTRVQKLQVFSGYVDTAPFLDLYPTTCTIQASCTLKRLLCMYWDPGLVASINILSQQSYNVAGAPGQEAASNVPGSPRQSTPLDSGLGAMLTNLLVKVGGWDPNSIKIQNFPTEFLAYTLATKVDPNAYLNAIKQLQDLLGFNDGGTGGAGGASAGGTAAGPGPAPGTPMNGNIPTTPGTYGGVPLNAQQLQNANAIAAAGKARGESQQAINVALMTAMQESTLNNLNYGDRDSLGLFQQRPSQGWGTPAQIMDPTYSANQFYNHLDSTPGWQNMPPTQAAQAVQRSAYPDAYAKWQPMAQALTGNQPPTPGAPPPPGGAAPPPGGAPGANGQPPAGQGGAGAEVPKYAYGLFNTMFQTSAFLDTMSTILTGEKALINDQQLMQIIQSVAKASLRSFQSAPDGKFVAYYPDYFGIHSGAATMSIQDIEMKNVSIQLSDGPLATHVYTAGDSLTTMGTMMSSSPQVAWRATEGYVTVEDQDVFKMMINVDAANAQDFTADAIYKRYGARPLVLNMPMVKDPLMERFQALYIFMQKWAEQYATSVQTTFMPEIFPGMRVELSGHELTVYVKEVTHTFDRKLGFMTELTIMAPSTPAGGLPGLPVSRSGAGQVPNGQTLIGGGTGEAPVGAGG